MADTKFEDINIAQLVIDKNSDRLSTLEDEWAVKINVADANLQIVEQSMRDIDKEYTTLRDALAVKRHELKDIEGVVSKGNYNLRKLKSEKQVLNRAFWRCRQS